MRLAKGLLPFFSVFLFLTAGDAHAAWRCPGWVSFPARVLQRIAAYVATRSERSQLRTTERHSASYLAYYEQRVPALDQAIAQEAEELVEVKERLRQQPRGLLAAVMADGAAGIQPRDAGLFRLAVIKRLIEFRHQDVLYQRTKLAHDVASWRSMLVDHELERWELTPRGAGAAVQAERARRTSLAKHLKDLRRSLERREAAQKEVRDRKLRQLRVLNDRSPDAEGILRELGGRISVLHNELYLDAYIRAGGDTDGHIGGVYDWLWRWVKHGTLDLKDADRYWP